MPKRVPLQTVVVQREVNGKRQNYTPAINEPFDFTAEEIKEIDAANPLALGKVAKVDVTEEPAKKAVATTTKAAGSKSKDEEI